MTHTESTLVVNFSSEYARFRMINGNRQLNEGKINRIIREINEGNDMLRYYPIQVKENDDRLDIIDGQHRFYICKKLKRPVHYILIQETKSLPQIAKINSNVEKWKTGDFINCFVANGNQNYITIQRIMDAYKVSLTVLLILLYKGQPGAEGSYPEINIDFRTGDYVVNFENETIELLEQCRRYSDFAFWKGRAFIIAIYRIREAKLVTLDDLYSAYKKRPEMLTPQANYKAYVTNLEQILNVGKQKRIVIL